MKLALKPRVQNLITDRVKSGLYPTPEDVVTAAIVTLDRQERFGDFAPGELNKLLAEGEESIRKYGTLDADEAFEARKRRRAARVKRKAKS
jgi:Arc/MetJ-type ribon-helix-helix transcriptional regulator